MADWSSQNELSAGQRAEVRRMRGPNGEAKLCGESELDEMADFEVLQTATKRRRGTGVVELDCQTMVTTLHPQKHAGQPRLLTHSRSDRRRPRRRPYNQHLPRLNLGPRLACERWHPLCANPSLPQIQLSRRGPPRPAKHPRQDRAGDAQPRHYPGGCLLSRAELTHQRATYEEEAVASRMAG